MGTYRTDRPGCWWAGLLSLVIIFIPIVGDIIVTVMIWTDNLTTGEKILWTLVSWIARIIGPFLYLLLGQKRNRVFDNFT